MRSAKISVVLAASVFSFAALSAPTFAATAHNSQAGAWGPRSNDCEATPYFAADAGCLGSYLQRTHDDGVFPTPDDARARYRARRPLS